MGNAVKDYVVISWPCTKGSVHWAKWRLLVAYLEIKSPTCGQVLQPLQSINCHDSRAHGHERHGPFTRLVGYGWFWSGRVLGLVGLATGVRPVSSVWCWLQG
jgi:hypothetical protein